MLPRLSRVAVFGTSTSAGQPQGLKEIKLAAGAMNVQVQYLDILIGQDIALGFRAANKARADAVLWEVSGSVSRPHLTQIVELAVKNRLPVIYESQSNVEAGGLMTYGVNVNDLDRRAAAYVDKILKGAKPADLPVEQPNKVRVHHQSESSQADRPDDSAERPGESGQGDQVKRRRVRSVEWREQGKT